MRESDHLEKRDRTKFSSGSIGIADLFFTASGLLTLCAVRKNSRKVLYQEDVCRFNGRNHPQSEFFHPFSLLFYNPKLPPFSTPVAHHNYEAGDQPCGRHAHIVAAEANRGERQKKGEREADAQVDETGSCRDLDIAGSLQETAGDVGDRAGPDEEHQDVEMFLCAPQGLSGDVEDLEKRPVKKQNHDTDGDTDQDTHQDGRAVTAAGTVQLFGADILSGEAGDGDVKALGRNVCELFDLQHGSVALDAGSAEGVDETLQDEETESN